MPEAGAEAQKLANVTSCPDDAFLLDCLRDIDAFDLVEYAAEVDFLDGPIVDYVSLTDDPLQLMSSGQMQKADILLGKASTFGHIMICLVHVVWIFLNWQHHMLIDIDRNLVAIITE